MSICCIISNDKMYCTSNEHDCNIQENVLQFFQLHSAFQIRNSSVFNSQFSSSLCVVAHYGLDCDTDKISVSLI